MRKLAHLSDLHFGRADPAVVDRLVGDLVAQRPDVVAVSGDLTQRAQPDEFAAARAFLQRLPCPVVVVPGNHDLAAYNPLMRMVDPLQRYRRAIGAHFPDEYRDAEIAVIGIDTTERIRLSWDWSGGRIRSGDIDEVRVRLGSARAPFVIVAAHHLRRASVDDGFAADPRRSDALRRLAGLGVDIALGGHHHRGDARIVTFGPEPDRQRPGGTLVLVHASTSTSSRVRGEPNSYNLLEMAGDAARCDVRVLGDAGFATALRRGFVRRDGVWRDAGVPA